MRKSLKKNTVSPPETRFRTANHLATSGTESVSEFEASLTVVYNAFNRWMVQCITAAGYEDFSPLEVLILHHIKHRNRAKSLAQIADTLNIRDLHTANYAIKKLLKRGLVAGEKAGKEMFYRTTEAGNAACDKYAEIRQGCLLTTLQASNMDFEKLKQVADIVGSLSGQYDQATRAASTL